MELGTHLPLMQFVEGPCSLQRLQATVAAARDCGAAPVPPRTGSELDAGRYAEPAWLLGHRLRASGHERRELELVAETLAPPISGSLP